MHSVKLLQKLLRKSCPKVHKKRLNCLTDIVTGLITGGQLWISALGRAIENSTTAKHNIKKVDTLVGNVKLHAERLTYYQFLASQFISEKARPIIIVDWSPVSGDCANNILRASMTGAGRTLTIYEEIHALKYYANDETHKIFLDNLQSILPEGCCPVVITDAGFRNPWFKLIKALGWNFLGRLRHNTQVQIGKDAEFKGVTTLHNQATSRPTEYSCSS